MEVGVIFGQRSGRESAEERAIECDFEEGKAGAILGAEFLIMIQWHIAFIGSNFIL